jgi:aspartate aminotransferase-like enzyme
MCRAVKVLCVAVDDDALSALKRASVGAEWELAPGATSEDEALSQLATSRAHVLVVDGGSFSGLLARAREAYPALRIVTTAEDPEATVVVSSLDDVRPAILGLPRPGGPVRA